MAARLLEWFQLAALACLLALGLLRMLALYARGIRVLASDRNRTTAQALGDILAGACLFLWWYELLAYAWPLQLHIIPTALGVVLFDAVALKVAGVVMWVTGLVIYGLALRAMGASWRIGIDRGAPGALVTDGIFAWSRNPIYLGFEACVFGTFLLQGRLVFLIIATALSGMLHTLIRREERFLAGTYGDTYRQYRRRVGRYVTWRRFHQGTPGE